MYKSVKEKVSVTEIALQKDNRIQKDLFKKANKVVNWRIQLLEHKLSTLNGAVI